MPVFGVFLVCIFPHSDSIRTRKTPITDTFHAVFLANYQRHKYKRKSRENNIQWSLQKQFSTMVFCEKDVLENFAKFTGQHLYLSFFLNKVSSSCNFIENKTPIKMFSCEFHRIFKNTSFHRTSKRTASQH